LVHSSASSEESRILVLTELLEQKAHSPFYQEGVSNALLKMAELGLTRAAAVLLQSGANLNFEGQQHPEDGGGVRRTRQPGPATAFPPVFGVTSLVLFLWVSFWGLLAPLLPHLPDQSFYHVENTLAMPRAKGR
jgi:hypothetical protein